MRQRQRAEAAELLTPRRLDWSRLSAQLGMFSKLREVERLLPFETAFGEHLKHRFDDIRVIQAAERDEDHSREALQVGGEHPGAAIGRKFRSRPLPDWAI